MKRLINNFLKLDTSISEFDEELSYYISTSSRYIHYITICVCFRNNYCSNNVHFKFSDTSYPNSVLPDRILYSNIDEQRYGRFV